MADKFGVVKAADPAEKMEPAERKKKQPREDGGQHKPFKKLAQSTKQADKESKEAAQKAAALKKEEETAAKKKADEEAKFGLVRKYAKVAKQRHPSLPDEVYDKIWNSKNKSEGKRLLRDYLRKAEA